MLGKPFLHRQYHLKIDIRQSTGADVLVENTCVIWL